MVSALMRLLPLISALALVLLALLTACDRGLPEERPGSDPTDREPATTERRAEDATPEATATPRVAVASIATPIPTPGPTAVPNTTPEPAATATPIPTPVPTAVATVVVPTAETSPEAGANETPTPATTATTIVPTPVPTATRPAAETSPETDREALVALFNTTGGESLGV